MKDDWDDFKPPAWIVLTWILSAVLYVGLLGVVVWGVVELVGWVTSK